jgi:hypothetical protein
MEGWIIDAVESTKKCINCISRATWKPWFIYRLQTMTSGEETSTARAAGKPADYQSCSKVQEGASLDDQL